MYTFKNKKANKIMRVVKKKNYKKRAIIIAASLLLLTGGAAAAYALVNNQSKDTETKSSSSSKNLSEKEKSKATEKDSSTETGPGDLPAITETEKDSPISYEGDNPNMSSSLTGVINYKAVVGDALSLRVTIDQSVSSGLCTLTLSSNDRVVTKTAPVAQNPSSATCEGFSIPLSELGSGRWDISLAITSGNRTGTFKDSVTI